MIPNLRMDYFHQREYLERPCNIRMSEKIVKKPLKDTMEGFEYSSLFTTKTYSILSYIVGGFVGSKSQMNNNKHNLSYDLSAAIFNLLNPCKFEKEKWFKKSSENFCNAPSKISPEGYDKYIVKSSHKGIDLELEWLENYMLDFEEQCYKPNPAREDSFNCDEKDSSSNSQSTMENSKLEDCLDDSIEGTGRVPACNDKPVNKECTKDSINYLNNQRLRQQSECSIESTDSESYVIFESPDQEEDNTDKEDWKLENFDFGSDEEEEEDEDDISNCDDYDITSFDKELAEANEKWKRNYQDVKTQDDEREKKVKFNENVKVNKIVAWNYAYRAARPGPWEQMARDRVRFQERILRLSPTISPVFRKEHREKIFKELYS